MFQEQYVSGMKYEEAEETEGSTLMFNEDLKEVYSLQGENIRSP